MPFERDLQGLIASADEVNRREVELIREVVGILGSWAAAKANNTEQLRKRIAELAMPRQQPLPYPSNQQGGADARVAINNLRGQGVN